MFLHFALNILDFVSQMFTFDLSETDFYSWAEVGEHTMQKHIAPPQPPSTPTCIPYAHTHHTHLIPSTHNHMPPQHTHHPVTYHTYTHPQHCLLKHFRSLQMISPLPLFHDHVTINTNTATSGPPICSTVLWYLRHLGEGQHGPAALLNSEHLMYLS